MAPLPPSISIDRYPVFLLKETIWMMSRRGRSSRLPCRATRSSAAILHRGQDLPRDPVEGDDALDDARLDRRLGHAVDDARLLTLGKGEAALVADGAEALRAVGAHSREDDAY